jgi:hypothetical protein
VRVAFDESYMAALRLLKGKKKQGDRMTIRRGIQYRPGSGWYFFNEGKEVFGNWSEMIELARQDSFAEVEKMIECEQADREQKEPV